MTDFKGLVAIVTGGAWGSVWPRRSCCQPAAPRRGVRPQPTAPRGEPALALNVDVTDTAGVDHAVGAVAEQLGGIDVVVNNAGIGAVGDVTANDDDGVAPRARRQRGRHRPRHPARPAAPAPVRAAAIVNTCSVAAPAGMPQRALYAPARAP